MIRFLKSLLGGGRREGGGEGRDDDTILVLRDRLYCDMPLDEVLGIFAVEDDPVCGAVAQLRAKDYPQALATLRGLEGRGESQEDLPYWLALAAAHRGAGELGEARTAARRLLSSAQARVVAQAWSVLRELGGVPSPPQADEVLGVVSEVGLDDGAVIVAGYPDGVGRLFWSRGGGVIGDGQPEPVQRAARGLVRAAAHVVAGLSPGARRGLPERGVYSLTVLTPSGAMVADEEIKQAEEESHPLHAVYVAGIQLFSELKWTYEN
jgi:hypothetical protein